MSARRAFIFLLLLSPSVRCFCLYSVDSRSDLRKLSRRTCADANAAAPPDTMVVVAKASEREVEEVPSLASRRSASGGTSFTEVTSLMNTATPTSLANSLEVNLPLAVSFALRSQAAVLSFIFFFLLFLSTLGDGESA